MTRKDIIDGLRYTVDMFLFNPTTGETYTEPRNDMDKITIDACRGAIELLEQKPKTGHWMPSHIPESILDECSECGFSCGAFTFNYCPNCGARMIEPQEERDKE